MSFSADHHRTPGTKVRRGAAIVEGLVVVVVLLACLFMTLDFGMAVHRWNTLAEAARRLARAAIVRGATAPTGAWGPAMATGTAADGSDFAAFLLPVLPSSGADTVTYELQWPDGTNAPDDRVRVRVRQAFRPVAPWLGGAFDLTADTTMRIVH